MALVPEVVERLSKSDVEVTLEAGAGEGASHPDSAYEGAGAKLGDGLAGPVVAKVAPPSAEEIGRLERGSVLIGFLSPLTAHDTVRALAEAGVTSFAMEAIPRITRAQSMDALSSQATVGGYRAALIAAQELPRFFPMLTTAAGTVRPAKVLVLGAGVAGLQAIATARRLGAQLSGLRRALGGEGADRVARRALPRARHGSRGRRGGGRLRARADRGGAGKAARPARRGDRQDGRRDLDRRRARAGARRCS